MPCTTLKIIFQMLGWFYMQWFFGFLHCHRGSRSWGSHMNSISSGKTVVIAETGVTAEAGVTAVTGV